MRMKQTILTLLFTLLTVNLWADDAKIIVWLNDGNKTEILFNQMPEFLYQDGNVSLQNGSTTMSWPLTNLHKFTFEALETIPTDVKDIKTAAKLDISKGCAVYDLNGRLLREQINSLSELPAGTYILKDGSVTTKVVRR